MSDILQHCSDFYWYGEWPRERSVVSVLSIIQSTPAQKKNPNKPNKIKLQY